MICRGFSRMDFTILENWTHVDPSTTLWSQAIATLIISLGSRAPEEFIKGAFSILPKAIAQVCGLIIFGKSFIPDSL